MKVLFLVLSLALGGGCADARNTWTGGDRALNNQSLQAVRKQIQAIDALAPHAEGVLAVGLAAIRSDLAIIELNLAKVEELHGPPPEVKPFSAKESEGARKQATEEHAKKGVLEWIYTIGTYLTVGLTIVAGALNAPVIGPYLATTRIGQFAARALGGKIVKMGLDATKTISVIRSEAETAPVTPQRVVELAMATFSKSTAAIADKVSDQIEKASNIEVTPIKDLGAPPS